MHSTLNATAAEAVVVAARSLSRLAAARSLSRLAVARSLSRLAVARSLSRLAAARSLRRVLRGRDASSFVHAVPRDARADVRAAPPDARAAVPYLQSAPVAARHSLLEAAVPEGASGAGQAAAGFGMPRRAPMRMPTESV
jgi:hypothetical protein